MGDYRIGFVIWTQRTGGGVPYPYSGTALVRVPGIGTSRADILGYVSGFVHADIHRGSGRLRFKCDNKTTKLYSNGINITSRACFVKKKIISLFFDYGFYKL